MPSPFEQLAACLHAEELVALATVTRGRRAGQKLLVWPGGRSTGDFASSPLGERVVEEARSFLAEQTAGSIQVAAGDLQAPDEGETEVFIEAFAPPPKLIVIGAVHVAIPLVSLARTVGFRTIVVDPRGVFATAERFAHADELITQWPQTALETLQLNESTYVVCLTHDEKLDNPALELALASPARYIGALGSKRTHAKRVKSLKERGLGDEEIRRIHAPIGLDLGGRRPEEIAVSILAEMVAARHGRA